MGDIQECSWYAYETLMKGPWGWVRVRDTWAGPWAMLTGRPWAMLTRRPWAGAHGTPVSSVYERLTGVL